MQKFELEKSIYVKTLSIHGSGIFTPTQIPAGSAILQISGEIISGNEGKCGVEEENNF